jgi:hypothetical protein
MRLRLVPYVRRGALQQIGRQIVTPFGTGVSRGLLLKAVSLTEFLYPTGRIHDFLLARIERVTRCAHVNLHVMAQGGAGRE